MPIEITKCSTPEGYEQYAKNVEAMQAPDWQEKAREAHRQAVLLRARQHGGETEAEQECLQAIFAYGRSSGSTASASARPTRGAWSNSAASSPRSSHTVTRPKVTTGCQALVAEGMQNMAFEAVVLRHPALFSAEAVRMSQERMAQWQTEG